MPCNFLKKTCSNYLSKDKTVRLVTSIIFSFFFLISMYAAHSTPLSNDSMVFSNSTSHSKKKFPHLNSFVSKLKKKFEPNSRVSKRLRKEHRVEHLRKFVDDKSMN